MLSIRGARSAPRVNSNRTVRIAASCARASTLHQLAHACNPHAILEHCVHLFAPCLARVACEVCAGRSECCLVAPPPICASKTKSSCHAESRECEDGANFVQERELHGVVCASGSRRSLGADLESERRSKQRDAMTRMRPIHLPEAKIGFLRGGACDLGSPAEA